MTNKKLVAIVTVQCVSCHTRRDIREGEIEPGEQPFCEKCYSPAVPIKAEVRERRT